MLTFRTVFGMSFCMCGSLGNNMVKFGHFLLDITLSYIRVILNVSQPEAKFQHCKFELPSNVKKAKMTFKDFIPRVEL